MSLADEQISNKPKDSEFQMSKIEEKIDNLTLTDSKPVKVAEPVIGNKSQDKQPIKQVDKPIEDKHETVESKDNSTNLPIETKVKPSVEPKSNPPQEQKTAVQRITTQQPTRPQLTTATEPQQQKRSSLEGCQSKSDSKNIVYDAEFLKSLQYSAFATKKPAFNHLVGVLLDEARPKHDSSLNELEPQLVQSSVSSQKD